MRTLALLVAVAVATATAFPPTQPEDPIVGIITYPTDGYAGGCLENTYVSWLAQSVVRVVPIRYNSTHEEVDYLLKRVNGVLFTGGGLSFVDTDPFFMTAKYVYQRVVEMNQAGDPMVLWGTCMGMQLIATVASGHNHILNCSYHGVEPAMLPLTIVPATADKTRFYGTAPNDVQENLKHYPTTANDHHCGVQPDVYAEYLAQDFNLVSTNVDARGKEFISFFEHKQYEIYASQWHPEAPMYIYITGFNRLPQTARVTNYASAFLLSRLQRNKHAFDTPEEAIQRLAINQPTVNREFIRNKWFYCYKDQF